MKQVFLFLFVYVAGSGFILAQILMILVLIAQLNENTPTHENTPTVTKAMTWKTLTYTLSEDKKHRYALVGSDENTNPYQGDTLLSQHLPILCIKKVELAKPAFIKPSQTPGGAWRGTWSGGYIGFTNPVSGKTLTSLEVANKICSDKFGSGYRMAEFHDGDASLWCGWDFWAELVSPNWQGRFWVSINNQPANPWGYQENNTR